MPNTESDKRERILHAAIGVLREEGLARFSQPRVAARAGLRQSHLTYYFPSRVDLLHAVADLAVAQRVAALQVIGTVTSIEQKIAVLAGVLADPEQTRVLIALTESADRDPGVRAAFAALGRELLPTTTELLTSAGVTPTRETLALIQSAGTGISVMLSAAAPPDAEAQAGRMLTTLLTSLRLSQTSTRNALLEANA